MRLKECFINIINSGSRIDPDKVYDEIKSFDYISFDIFDTLIKRNVSKPMDVFGIMEKSIGNDFAKKRIDAEKRARKESHKNEILIEDIYSYFPREERDYLIKLELEIEKKCIVPNLPMAEVYRRCVKGKKNILIVSDIYWPEDSIRDILENNGYTGYKALYLSSKTDKVKRDGGLFRFVLKNENIVPAMLVHIGDSYKADYTAVKSLGIRAIKIPRYLSNIEFRGKQKKDTLGLVYLNSVINNTFTYIEDPFYQLGYSQFGKLLFGFVQWIHDEALQRGINKIFFLSRDGYIIKKAYEACIQDPTIKTAYLEVSRRSLRVPVLWMDCTFETILKLVVNAKLIKIESIFDGLGLDINKYEKIIKKQGLELHTIFDRRTIKNDQKLKSLINEIRADIISNSKKEYEVLQEYLNENKVSGRFAVVDIGYAGSMQRYIQQTLDQMCVQYDITGLYLAVADFYTKNILPGVKLDLNGYLFDFQHNNNAADTRSSFVGLFESLFLEQDGSVKNYIITDTGVVAERYPCEYEENGNPTDDSVKIKGIQRGAIDFIKEIKNDEIIKVLELKPEDYFWGLHEIGTNPTLRELNLLGDISFYDEGVTEKLASPKSICHYIVHFKDLRNDFLKCRWKTGFMKKLLKIKLPYLKMYELARKLK